MILCVCVRVCGRMCVDWLPLVKGFLNKKVVFVVSLKAAQQVWPNVDSTQAWGEEQKQK